MQRMEYEQLLNLTDKKKLLLEEGTPIAIMRIVDGENVLATAAVDIVGTPAIRYKGQLYKGAKSFPADLVRAIEAGNSSEYSLEESNAYAIHYGEAIDYAYLDGATADMLYEAIADTVNKYAGKKAVPPTYAEFERRCM